MLDITKIRICSGKGDIAITKVKSGIKIGLKDIDRTEKRNISKFLKNLEVYFIEKNKAEKKLTVKEALKNEEIFVKGDPDELIIGALNVLSKTKIIYTTQKKDVAVAVATPPIKHGC